MEPPRDGWHSSGALDESANGPCGEDAVATERHSVELPVGSTA